MENPNLLLHRGSIPGDLETEEIFFRRIAFSKEFMKNPSNLQQIDDLPDKTIPWHHWDWAGKEVERFYGIIPKDIPAFYDNRGLTLFQGGATWIAERENIRFAFIRLKKVLRKKKLFTLYSREEILAHEAIHVMRCGFSDSPYEELFAYLVSSSSLRRIFGPIIQRPWEAYIFLLPFALLPFSFILPLVYYHAFISLILASLSLGLFRLVKLRLRFFRLLKKLTKMVGSQKRALQIMLSLSGKEIDQLSSCKRKEIPSNLRRLSGEFRWKFSFERYFAEDIS